MTGPGHSPRGEARRPRAVFALALALALVLALLVAVPALAEDSAPAAETGADAVATSDGTALDVVATPDATSDEAVADEGDGEGDESLDEDVSDDVGAAEAETEGTTEEDEAAIAEAEAEAEWIASHPAGWGEESYPGPSPADLSSPVEGTSIAQRIGAYLGTAMAKTRIPGVAVIVVDRAKTIYEGTFGDCTSVASPFVIGSLSKSFTGVGIMCLVQDGSVSLDAQVTDYLPDLDLGAPVTIRQLLNQTGGLGAYQSVSTARVVGEQGTFCYANVNYDLLGKVIESVSGETYGRFMAERVYGPLGLQDTYGTLSDAVGAGLQTGHRNWFGLEVADGFTHVCSDTSWGTEASGYTASSIADMGRYLQMYLDGGDGVLSLASISAMFNDNVYDESSDTYYGMGWTTYWRGDEIAQSHDGLVENYASSMCLLPERGIGVVLLADSNDYSYGNYATYTMMGDILDLVTGDDPTADAAAAQAASDDAATTAADGQGATGDGTDESDADSLSSDTQSYEEAIFGTTLVSADSSDYLTAHASSAIAYLVLVGACAVPLILVPSWRRRVRAASPRRRAGIVAGVALAFGALPVLLLKEAPFFVGMAWVEIRDFTPDLAVTIVLSAALLVANGVARIVVLLGPEGEGHPSGRDA